MATRKITVTLPDDLLARIEKHRQGTGANRSGTITDLLWRGWQAVEDDSRAERYRAAYAAQPETGDEAALSEEASARWLASLGPWQEAGPLDQSPGDIRARAAK